MRPLLISLLLLLANTGLASLNAAPNWVDSSRFDDKAYFLHALNPRIEIYNFQSQAWDSSITLSKTPSAFATDDSFLYIAYGKALYRYNKDGSGETHIANISNNVRSIKLDGNILFADYSSNSISVDSFNRSTLAKIDSFNTTSYHWSHDFEIDPERNRLFAANNYSRIAELDYDDNGTFAASAAALYFSDNFGQRIYQWPNGSRYVAYSGTVYNSSQREKIAQLESNIIHIDFVEDTLPVIATEGEVIAYSVAYQETGRTSLENKPEAHFVHHSTEFVFAFYPSDESENGISVEAISYDTLSVDDPTAPIDPSTLSFSPDDIIIDQNGILYLSHRTFGILFRWDSGTQAWLENLPLKSSPNTLSFAENQNRIYVGYESGEITYFDTTSDTLTETLFKNVGHPVGLIVRTGDYLFVDQYEGNSQSYHIYNDSGTDVDSTSHGSRDQSAVWNESTRRIVYTSQGNYNRVHSGGIGTDGKLTDYTFSHSSLSGQQAPLYSHPTQGLILTANGYLLKSDEQGTVTTVPDPIFGATWINGRLHTAQGGSIKNWDLPTYEENATSYSFSQQPVGLAGTPDDHLLLITQADSGQIRIKKLDTSYSIIAPSTLSTPLLHLDKIVGTSTRLEWSYVSGAETYALERSEDSGATWETIANIADAESTSFVDNGLILNSEYSYRVLAKNGDLSSPYSNTILVDTSITPNDLPPLALEDIKGNLTWAEADSAGTLYLSFRNTAAIYRYDLVEQNWIESIPLKDAPTAVHISDSRNAILVGYRDGTVSFISLSGVNYSEIPFAVLTGDIRFISSNSGYIIASDYYNQNVYDNVGGEYDSDRIMYPDSNEQFWWDEFSQRFYWKDSYIYATELDENHQLKESSLVSDVYNSGNLIAEYFEKSLLLLSDGSIYSVNTQGQLLSLNRYLVSGVWVGGNLFTSSDRELQKWNETTYEEEAVKTVQNSIQKLVEGPEDTIVVVTQSSYTEPKIELLKTDLNVAPPDTLAKPIAPVLSYPANNEISVNWQDVGGENGYKLERRTNGGDWEDLAELPANQTYYQDNNASSDNTYQYRVKAVNGELESQYSDILEITKLEPTAPSNLSAEITEDSEIRLNWDAAENAYAYEIQKSTNSRYWSNIKTVSKSTLQWIDGYNIYSDQLYFYRISALGSYGRTAISETIAAGIDYGLPTSPSLSTNVIDTNSIRVYINGGHSNTEKVRIERALGSEPDQWIEVDTISIVENEVIDTGLTQNTRYLYRSVSINPKGEGPPSTPVEATTNKLLPPSVPTILIGQTENDHVQVYSFASGSTDSLSVYRRKFLESDPELIFESSDSRLFLDEDVSLGEGYLYYAIAENEAGKSPQSEPKLITVKETETLFEENFEADIPDDRFEKLDGLVTTEDGNKFLVPNKLYDAYISPSKKMSNGGTIAFSVKFTKTESYYNGYIELSLFGGTSNLFRYYQINSSQLASPNGWNRFYLDIPEEMVNTDLDIRIGLNGYDSDHASPWNLDDILIIQHPLKAPNKPIAVVAKETSEGDNAVFWIPSPETNFYLVESSADDGVTWTEIAQVYPPATYFHDIGHITVPVQYRVSTVNNGGASEPTYSEKVQGDYDLALALTTGIEKVITSPDSYSLHTPQELEEAIISGQNEVKLYPDRFGLFREEVISHLYYRVNSEWVALKGGLISVTWSLYQSSNLTDWTKYTSDLSFELEPETQAKFIKIGPNAEPSDAAEAN
ncbi:Fibronectin type III domain protein [Verrucomicrobiia bacterium DG1235]|nr:Fibronectin type III domain protein [Verrucomicrobiae bacterium DG1235]